MERLVTNSFADSVRIVLISQFFFFKFRIKSNILYAAIPPDIISNIFFFVQSSHKIYLNSNIKIIKPTNTFMIKEFFSFFNLFFANSKFLEIVGSV